MAQPRTTGRRTKAYRAGYMRALGDKPSVIAEALGMAVKTVENYSSDPASRDSYEAGYNLGVLHQQQTLLPKALRVQGELLDSADPDVVPSSVRAMVSQAVVAEHGRGLDRAAKQRQASEEIARELLVPMVDGIAACFAEFVPEDRRGECELRLRTLLAGSRDV